MSLIESVHGGYVHKRRVGVLRDHLAPLFPAKARVLDVGCGDGLLARLILEQRADLEIRGIDVLVRDGTRIPVDAFDGNVIPHPDKSFDDVMFVDVLHHTEDPMVLLKEAARVARRSVVIKDHRRDGMAAGATLRFMDRIGNERYGVALPCNYWPHRKWHGAFDELGLKPAVWNQKLGLYPWPASWVFGRGLHFIAKLVPASVGKG